MSRWIDQADMTADEIIKCAVQARAVIALCERAAWSDLQNGANGIALQQVAEDIQFALQLAHGLLGPAQDALESHEALKSKGATSPIMSLFEQWNSLRDHSDQPGLDDDELDRRCAQTDAVMKQIGQLPATSAADFAAKLSCITHYGAYSNLGGDCGGLGSALICEAAALCGQAEKVSRVPTDHQARGQRNG